jgi:hypothetical protein
MVDFAKMTEQLRKLRAKQESESMAQNQGSAKPKPVITFQVGRIRAAVWANQVKQEDGSVVTHNSVTLEKSWKPDKNKEEWDQRAIPLFLDELHDVVLVLQQAELNFRVTAKN